MWGGHVTSTEREPIGQGDSDGRARCSGVQGQSPSGVATEVEKVLAFQESQLKQQTCLILRILRTLNLTYSLSV